MAGMRWRSAVVGLALVSADAAATTLTKVDLPQMVQAAERIVVGTVVGAESVWIGRSLYTRYTVAVEETLHGESTPTVRVLVLGGVDRSRPLPIGMAVAGAPIFAAGGRRADVRLRTEPLTAFRERLRTLVRQRTAPASTRPQAQPRRVR